MRNIAGDELPPLLGFDVPDVLVIRKRALVRFARPSMFSVPMKDVLIVFTALNW